MGVLMNFYFFNFSNGSEAISSILCVVLVIPLFTLPALIGAFLYKKSEVLGRIDIKHKFESLYEGLNFDNPQAKYLVVVQYFRRWTLVFSIVFLKDYYYG